MGLDVTLYAEVDPTPEQLEAANKLLSRSSLGWDWQKDGRVVAVMPADEWTPATRVEFRTLARFYGKGYERGDWPAIYGAICLMQAAFPGAKVYYGSDSGEVGTECDDAHMTELWAHFLGPHGNGYRDSQ